MFAKSVAPVRWFALNAVGIACFVIVGSLLWVDRRVTDVPPDELRKYLAWQLGSVLLLLCVLVANVAWAVRNVRMSEGASRATSILVAMGLIGCWYAAFAFDAGRRVID